VHEDVKFENGVASPEYNVPTGAIEIRFFVNKDKSPVLSAKDTSGSELLNKVGDYPKLSLSVDENATGVPAGTRCWVAKLSNINYSLTIDVAVDTYTDVHVDLSSAVDASSEPIVQLAKANQYDYHTEGGKTEFSLYVHPDYALDSTGNNMGNNPSPSTGGSASDLHGAKVTVKDTGKTDGKGWYEWIVTVTGVPELANGGVNCTVTPANLLEMYTVYVQGDSHVTPDKSQKRVADGGNVEFTVTMTDDTYMPALVQAEIDHINSTASTAKAVLKQGTDSKTWTVTIGPVDQSNNPSTKLIHINRVELPVIKVLPTAGVIPATSGRILHTDKTLIPGATADGYTKEIGFELAEGYVLSETPVSFRVQGQTPSGVSRTALQKVGDEYLMTVTLDGTVAFEGKTIEVIVAAEIGHTAEVVLAEGTQMAKGEDNPKRVVDGEKVRFDIVVSEDYELQDGTNYKVLERIDGAPGSNSTWRIESKDVVTDDLKIELVTVANPGLNYTATIKTGDSNITDVDGNIDGAQYIIEGRKAEFTVNVKKNFIPVFSAITTEDNKIPADVKIECTKFAGTSDTNATWKFTLTNITKSLTIEFAAKEGVVLGADTDGNVIPATPYTSAAANAIRDEDGDPLVEVCLAPETGTDYSSPRKIGAYKLMEGADAWKNINPNTDQWKFILYVADECTLDYAGSVALEASNDCYWSSVFVENYEGTIGVIDGYHPVEVTVKIRPQLKDENGSYATNWKGSTNYNGGAFEEIPFMVIDNRVQ